MSILERSASPQAPAAESGPHSDRLRVITAGRVGNMEARLGASGFDVVAAAETEDALIDAVSVDEPDAIVVEADLCASLEHVRDLAPDAVLIVVGDHTPAGALGRVERGMSGTAMAGLLHALVAEGVGAAVVWGLVPTFRAGAGLQRVGLSLLSAKADLVRAHLANALRDPAQLVTAAGTVAVTVSASLLVTLSAPRTHERPERVPVPAPAVERARAASGRRCVPHDANTRPWSLEERGRARRPTGAEPRSVQRSWSSRPSTERCLAAARRRLRLGLPAAQACRQRARSEGEPGDRRGPNRVDSRDHGRHADQGQNQGNADQGENEGHADQGGDQGNNDHETDNNDQGETRTTTIRAEPDNRSGETQDNNDQGENQDNNDQGETRTTTIRARTRTTTIKARTRTTTIKARTRVVGDRRRPDPAWLPYRGARASRWGRCLTSPSLIGPVSTWTRVSRSLVAGAPARPAFALGSHTG